MQDTIGSFTPTVAQVQQQNKGSRRYRKRGKENVPPTNVTTPGPASVQIDRKRLWQLQDEDSEMEIDPAPNKRLKEHAEVPKDNVTEVVVASLKCLQPDK